MRGIPKIFAVTILLLVAAIVFSPLAVALCGTSLQMLGLAEAFRGTAGAYAASAASALVSAIVSLVIGVPFALLVLHQA
jgi:ABC-type sulfate transport system permease component